MFDQIANTAGGNLFIIRLEGALSWKRLLHFRARMDFPALHSAALAAAARLRSAEVELVALLQEIEACRGHQKLGYPSLFVYVRDALHLPEASAYQLITVSRKAREVPELMTAIQRGEITVSKAKAISAVIGPENHASWLEKAKTSSVRILERLVVADRPDQKIREKVRLQSDGLATLELTLAESIVELLKRAQDILSQKRSAHVRLAETIEALAEEFLSRNDPVRKATLHVKSSRQIPQQNQTTLTAHARHLVNIRDQGRCQYRLPNGEQCSSHRWLHLHHRKPQAEGGGHEPENLVTLCSAHHRIAHKSDTRPLYHS